MNRPPTPDVSDDQEREHSLPDVINIKVLQFPFYLFRFSIIFRLAWEFVKVAPVFYFKG